MSVNATRFPLIAAVLIALLMTLTLAWQGYGFWVQEQQRAVNARAVNVETSATAARQRPNVSLATLNLFGNAASNPGAEEIDTENLPETNLRIFLRGVLASDGEFPASALIEDSNSRTEAYMAGNEIPGGATLRTILPNRVILERNGKLENLYFPETDNQAGLSVAESQIAETTANQSDETYDSRSDSTNVQSSSQPASDQRREEIRQRLEQLRERLRNNSN
ncbi:type II secretion system protein N [Marinobacter changyiensis]|uniref:type II secretion system protein N n=1 Tax=Marinobacter changyiensis TaxID=2604091 RepID=UPI0012647641|nr:type II secretion system protein N [Marinobacter changyiensis]